jgi:hypothetical protein
MTIAQIILMLFGGAGLAFFCTPTARHMARWVSSAGVAIEQKRLALPLAFVITVILGAIPWLLGNVAPPSFHDEFAYLLGADTFAKWRLTNPTPAFADHFATFHEIVRPTYQSKFPPGQSIALFIGQLLGAPIIGAFGSVALASAAAYWMLRAALPARWAMVGAILTAIHPLIFVWSQMYWGGGVPLIGSMLLVGSIIRIAKANRLCWSACITLGIAIGIFLNTRLLEGAITCGLVGVWILISILRRANAHSLSLYQGRGRGRGPANSQKAPLPNPPPEYRGRECASMTIWIRSALVAWIALIPIVGWMGYYNWRVTGHPPQLPYMLHTGQYMRAPLFTWQGELPTKTYPDERMRQFHEEYEVEEWQKAKQNFVPDSLRKLREYCDSFGGILLIPLLPMLPRVLRRSWIARLCFLVAIAFPILQIGISVYFRPHYCAPMMGFVILLIVLLLREWSRIRFAIGPAIAHTTILLFFALAAMTVWNDYGNANPRGATRQRMIEQLERAGGQHLILVQYTPRPQLLFEWVYNSADIDSQKVIWARSLGETKDRELLEHYKDRTQWRLIVDNSNLSPLERLN